MHTHDRVDRIGRCCLSLAARSQALVEAWNFWAGAPDEEDGITPHATWQRFVRTGEQWTSEQDLGGFDASDLAVCMPAHATHTTHTTHTTYTTHAMLARCTGARSGRSACGTHGAA